MKQDMILILDLGSDENTVLARMIRDLGVYSEIKPHDITEEELAKLDNVKGIILNGGPLNIVDGKAIEVRDFFYDSGVPVLALNYAAAKGEHCLDQWPAEEDAMRAVVNSFLFDTCHAEANWNMKNFVADQIELIRRQVGDKKVLLALSGGVDSSVVAA